MEALTVNIILLDSVTTPSVYGTPANLTSDVPEVSTFSDNVITLPLIA